MLGALNEEEIDGFLKKQIIGRIGCQQGGEVYVVPISYAYDGKYIYCHTQEGRKTNMIKKNPRICFEVDSLEATATWKSVIIWGEYIEVTDKIERAEALKNLLNRVYPFVISKKMKLGEHWPFAPDDLNNIKGIVFKISIQEKSGRYDLTDEPWNFVKG